MHVLLRPATLAAIVIAAFLVVACGGGDKKDDNRGGSVTGLATAASTGSAGAGTGPTEGVATTATGMPLPKEGTLLDSLVIAKINLETFVETRGVTSQGAMEEPTGKDAVAWYDFSEFPGFGGNAVFSAHVDWFTGELGPFARMKELREGDEVIVKMSDGFQMTFKVVSTKLYKVSDVKMGEVVGRTEKDSLTFITCEGTFSRSNQDYSHRRIVRAERVS